MITYSTKDDSYYLACHRQIATGATISESNYVSSLEARLGAGEGIETVQQGREVFVKLAQPCILVQHLMSLRVPLISN